MYAKCILLLLLCLVHTKSLMAKIRNGYSSELTIARECLQRLNERLLINPDMSDGERRRIHAAMKKHAQVIEHFELTELLLEQFRSVSPAMYMQMDALKDKRGRETDLYVRFIPEADASVMLRGASFFQISSVDEDASQSKFGKFTVAIDVWICDTSLNLLAHEFGHTRYIVPNLAEYRQYYKYNYQNSRVSLHVGHSPTDASGEMAYIFGHQYLRDRRQYKSTSGTPQRIASMLKDVRKRVRESVESRFAESVASSNSF
ncbi:MAG: hypothetical protein QM762_14280 [Chryseolinea sp.]